MISQVLSTYPDARSERDEWILAQRSQRNALDALRPYAFFVEEERSASGEIVPIATVFLTNRECPWRCLMCDLWKNTLATAVPEGAIPAQIEYALDALPAARQVKLYNSGSFFDPQAIPLADYEAIAKQVGNFDRVIVESHPALIGDRCFRFRDLVSGRLEVAMGLETAHPEILKRLNKGMTLDQFGHASETLRAHDIDLRVFILVKPPFMQVAKALEWAKNSLTVAADCGATAAIFIPTRGGNGALDQLALRGDFVPPNIAIIEAALEYGISLGGCRVFVDLWDIDKLLLCGYCRRRRVQRLRSMNLNQAFLPPISCDICTQ